MKVPGIELVKFVQNDNEQVLMVSGGKNSHKGTYQITVVAREPLTGVENRDAVFILEAKPTLRLSERPSEYDSETIYKVNEVYKLPVPTYKTKNKLTYTVSDSEGAVPTFLTAIIPKHSSPYLKL